MKTFATLYRRIDAATSTQHKRQALIDYLRLAVGDPEQYASAAWTVYFLAGGKPRQMISTKLLRQLALEATDLPEWLLDECYHSVGDLAETSGAFAAAADPCGRRAARRLDERTATALARA